MRELSLLYAIIIINIKTLILIVTLITVSIKGRQSGVTNGLRIVT